MRRWPRVTAHLIAESLGYATPTEAATIVADGKDGQTNYCEWIDACYQGDARAALRDAINHRYHHRGYMAEYRMAKALVDRAIATDKEPELASWF